MRVTMIGSGYVGLVSGTCFADFGHTVTCVDLDSVKINNLKQGIIPIYEPGLDTLVQNNIVAGRLDFTTDLASSVKNADAVFIAVGTPSRRGDGHADLSYVYAAAEQIADNIQGYTVVVTKSTVPVGTNRKVMDIIAKRNPSADFDVASNPEFLREGSAIEDFKRPDRIVVGTLSEKAQSVMRDLYRPLFINETPILFSDPETAEMIKYAANAFLATKITFINEISDLCEKVGANVQQVSKGIGLDNRIGKKFLHAGPGYGGSCFPKDTLALAKIGQDYDSPIRIVETVIDINDKRKKSMAQRVINACDGDVNGKNIAILGVTFKPNTDDMRDAPSLDIIPALQQAGAKIYAHDPEGMTAAKPLLPNVSWCNSAYEACQDADIVCLITEWDIYRALDLEKLKSMMRSPRFVDLRNVYSKYNMAQKGFAYYGIGVTSSQESKP
jgi:UDPglucose 6-dehydrogenase